MSRMARYELVDELPEPRPRNDLETFGCVSLSWSNHTTHTKRGPLMPWQGYVAAAVIYLLLVAGIVRGLFRGGDGHLDGERD